MSQFKSQLLDILHSSRIQLSDLKPSEWTELNRVLTSDITSRPGRFNYNHTPYLREVVDCLSPYHPAKIVAVKKGAQIGFSTGVIESGIGWIMSQNPGNILFMTGSPDLTEIAMNKKIDQMIESSGLRPLIGANVKKAKNQRTGDTKKGKEFPGGSLIAGNASNHKLLRQISVRYGFLDDLDSIKQSSQQSGDTIKLFEKRFSAYKDLMKIYYISTPERKEGSNIDKVFSLGDQRYYNVPCPCCGEQIVLMWAVEIDRSKDMGGITWKVDNHGRLIEDSVGYVCQKCGSFFDERPKHEMNLAGEWIGTAQPSEEGYYSYHISALYAPTGHFDWTNAVRDYMAANPAGGRKEEEWKVFVNTILGDSYEHTKEAPDANEVQAKIRDYKVGTIPEFTSHKKDGNGKIVMITCACDLNGTEDDARLDYEVVAWSATGSSYSLIHGSIGTFEPRENQRKVKADRERWTYNHNRPNSVWPELEKILTTDWTTDTGRKMRITVTGIDCGHYTNQAYAFIDKTNVPYVFGIKGDKEEQYRRFKADLPIWKPARERAKLYLLDVNYIKDLIADIIKLKWDRRSGESQPPGYMNYPQPEGGLYLFNNFFEHYESEHRTDDIKNDVVIGTRWVKKSSSKQNHFWDVYVYNFALKEMWADLVLKESPLKKGTWGDFVNYILGKP